MYFVVVFVNLFRRQVPARNRVTSVIVALVWHTHMNAHMWSRSDFMPSLQPNMWSSLSIQLHAKLICANAVTIGAFQTESFPFQDLFAIESSKSLPLVRHIEQHAHCSTIYTHRQSFTLFCQRIYRSGHVLESKIFRLETDKNKQAFEPVCVCIWESLTERNFCVHSYIICCLDT